MSKKKRLGKMKMQWQYYAMLIPGIVFVFIFNYIPAYGGLIAFMDFGPGLGFKSPWIGFDNFVFIFSQKSFLRAIRNTVFIGSITMVLGIVVPVTVSLLLNEVRKSAVKRTIQTMIYLPHFISWVILAGVFGDILGDKGIVNQLITAIGGMPISFMGDPDVFPWTIIVTEVWKGFGYGTIIYLAALANIDPGLYEAAIMDGAKRFQQIRYITLPMITPTIVLMTVLSLGSIFSASFDQIFNMYAPIVYETGDVIATYMYRLAFVDAQYGVGAAVGLVQQFVGAMFVLISNFLADKLAGYRIW